MDYCARIITQVFRVNMLKKRVNKNPGYFNRIVLEYHLGYLTVLQYRIKKVKNYQTNNKGEVDFKLYLVNQIKIMQ